MASDKQPSSQQPNFKGGNQPPKEVPVFTKTTDSPIERAKMPYNLFKIAQGGLTIGIIANIFMILYSFDILENNRSLFDMAIFTLSFLPYIVLGIQLSVISVAEKEIVK